MTNNERKRDRLRRVTTSWAGRTWATGRMAASVGAHTVGTAVARLGGQEHRELGEALTARMDEMKGLMMKLGQMASYLEGTLPPEAQEALRKLQREAEPLDPDVVAAIVAEELGLEAFDDFEPEPIAAASIGQVHRAVVAGEPVAVKVQYPGIAETFAVDLSNLDKLGIVGTLGTALSRHELVGELRDRLSEECDYLQEAAHLERFRALWAHDERVVLPRVVRSHTTRQVLTTTFVEGKGFYDFAAGASQAERDRAGALLFEFAFGSIFGHAAFNGDPHPGNYLFLDDGRVAFLDFGCVRWFDGDFIETWKRIARVVLDGRREDLPEAMQATGIVDGGRYDYDYHWEVMRYLYEPFLRPGFRYNAEYVRKSWELMLWRNPNLRRTAMPREWLLSNRLHWGLNSVLAHLGAGADWGTLYRACLDRPLVPAGRPDPL